MRDAHESDLKMRHHCGCVVGARRWSKARCCNGSPLDIVHKRCCGGYI